jgi:hypothetical protein
MSDYSKIKPLALYFPQFHEFEQNNLFWGKGFTEWNNLNTWEPFFEGHKIKMPLWGHYNLLNDDAILLQCDYARRIGIHGFVHYHYWFSSVKGGKVMFEATEKYMNMEERLPFCFMWANEPWTKRWDGESGTVLIDQSYDNRDCWEEHIEYLIRAFRNEKYIKVKNRPVLFVYMYQDIETRKEMFSLFKKRAVEAGFDGIYLIESLSHKFVDRSGDEIVDRVCHFNPNYMNMKCPLPFLEKKDNYFVLDVNKRLVQLCELVEKNLHDDIPCIFTGWDASPRAKGRVAHIETIADPKIFESSLVRISETIKCRDAEDNFMLIFAWNEWGEGAVLEPDGISGFEIGNAFRRVFKKVGNR